MIFNCIIKPTETASEGALKCHSLIMPEAVCCHPEQGLPGAALHEAGEGPAS